MRLAVPLGSLDWQQLRSAGACPPLLRAARNLGHATGNAHERDHSIGSVCVARGLVPRFCRCERGLTASPPRDDGRCLEIRKV